jgi:cAMP-dependent protein kinase regulator
LRWDSSHHIDDLLAKKKYDEAIDLLEERLQQDPGDFWVRLQFGDALVSKGQKDRAAKVFMGLIEQLASDGKLPKAIAVLKKLKRMEPGQSGVEERLLDLWHEEAPDDPTKVIPFRSSAARSPLFGDFSREELLEVVRGLELRSYDAGAILVSEGEPGESLFILTHGTVRAFVKTPTGRNVEVRRMEEGEFFGEVSLLSGGTRSATVTAATPCELLELDRRTLEDISQRHPRVRTLVEEFYAQRAGSASELEARSS